MSKLKFANDLFLGRQELDRFKESIQEEGYIKIFSQLIQSPGVVRKDSDATFNALKPTEGSSPTLISILSGTAACRAR